MSDKNLFSCRGKIAVVTGGAGLIGREIVRELSANGATVYAADNDAAKAAKHFSSRAVKFTYLDITSEGSIIEAFAAIKKQAGRIDILVNCAYPRTKDWCRDFFEDEPFESWKTNLDWQLGGYFLCCRQAAKYMKGRGGSIINIGSIYGVTAPDFSLYEGTKMAMPAAYPSIKGGLITFTKYLASYYGKDKIRANIVSPGGILDRQPQSFVQKYSRKVPLGRMGTPQDVAGAVVFLASDASKYITGHNLMVDGGWTAW